MELKDQETKQAARPKQVTNAVTLIYASLAVSAVYAIISAVSSFETGVEFSTAFAILTCSGASFIITIFITTRIADGRSWARTLTLVLFALGALGVICNYRSYLDHPLAAADVAITIVLQLSAIILLFQQPSNDWFKAMTKQYKQESDHGEQQSPVETQREALDEGPDDRAASFEKEAIPVTKIVTIAGAEGAGMGLLNAAFWAITMAPQSTSEREMIYFLIAAGLALGAALGAAGGFFFSLVRQKPNRSPVRWAIFGGFLGGLFSFGCCFFSTILSFV